MITLNTQRGLTKVDNWDDIRSLPGFMQDLNPQNQKLDSIIGRYIFSDKIRCGLSNCHTPHAKGYVASTTAGQITNIGKDCGKKYFGVDFENLSKKFDQDVQAQENRSTLVSFINQLEDLSDKITDLRKSAKGADWIYKNLKLLTTFGGDIPADIARNLLQMAKNRNGMLTTSREATQKEIDEIEVIQDKKIKEKPHYINTSFAEIKGIESLYPENDLKNLLIVQLETELAALKSKNVDELSNNELTRWAKWIGTVEQTLITAEKSISSGRTFLQASNLSPLKKITTNQSDANLFNDFLKTIK